MNEIGMYITSMTLVDGTVIVPETITELGLKGCVVEIDQPVLYDYIYAKAHNLDSCDHDTCPGYLTPGSHVMQCSCECHA